MAGSNISVAAWHQRSISQRQSSESINGKRDNSSIMAANQHGVSNIIIKRGNSSIRLSCAGIVASIARIALAHIAPWHRGIAPHIKRQQHSTSRKHSWQLTSVYQ